MRLNFDLICSSQEILTHYFHLYLMTGLDKGTASVELFRRVPKLGLKARTPLSVVRESQDTAFPTRLPVLLAKT